jgi:hypothetical protein
MRFFSAAIAALAVLGVTVPVQAEEARDIIDKGIAALGGPKALETQKAMTWKVKGTFHAFGAPIPYTADYAFKFPNKLRFDMAMNAQGQEMKMTVLYNGQKGWEIALGQEQEMTETKRKETHHMVHAMSVSMLLPLADKAYRLTSLGDSQDGGRTLVGVKVSREGERDVSLFFDKATGLLHKSSFRALDEIQMKEVT